MASRVLRRLPLLRRVQPFTSTNTLTRAQALVRFASTSAEAPPSTAKPNSDKERNTTSLESTESEAKAIPDIPLLEIPPRVKGWPTPWFSKEDFENYLEPLYSRGWKLKFRKTVIGGEEASAVTSLLDVQYSFATYQAGIAFINGVSEIAEAEHGLIPSCKGPPLVLLIMRRAAPYNALSYTSPSHTVASAGAPTYQFYTNLLALSQAPWTDRLLSVAFLAVAHGRRVLGATTTIGSLIFQEKQVPKQAAPPVSVA
ncbi:hypothetical protein DXG03_004109 [Asterophora parasitica]|uniref:Uncharacterized protein n=1 Tax=Asterophora parasitica TaxID=117018 RepID=A0A9P7KAF6_9AGAR|nr:hypothetical protein DXG03_004109 [Asterophora parasitica]